MKVHVIGGGPAGLYYAILMKKAWPQTEITVFERNRPDDTFGFGVVFSDQTLDRFEAYDRESYRAIIGHFAYWDDIEIHFRGTTHRVGGNGFCGCSRSTLLKILSRRARSLGVQLKYQTDVSPTAPNIRGADLVVAADGINSRVRETFAEQFRPSIDLRPNKFSWMGSTRPFDAFTFFFRDTRTASSSRTATSTSPGARPGSPKSIRRPSRAPASTSSTKKAPRASSRTVFAEELQGHRAHHQPLDLAQFPDHPLRALGARQRRAARRRQGDRAFLHRLRHQARDGGRHRAVRGVPRDRWPRRQEGARALRDSSGATRWRSTQHSADVSLVWFEHVNRFWNMDPTRFAFGLMTRSKAITYDNLALRAPRFVAAGRPGGGARHAGARLRRSIPRGRSRRCSSRSGCAT